MWAWIDPNDDRNPEYVTIVMNQALRPAALVRELLLPGDEL